jgi:hypothetical protein
MRTLLSNLLRLDRLGEFLYCESEQSKVGQVVLTCLSECQVCDRHILENKVELARALQEVRTDPGRDNLTLSDELGGVKLRDDALENLVSNRRQHALVVVQAERLVDLRQVLHVRAREYAERDGHHLQVLRTCGGGNVLGVL